MKLKELTKCVVPPHFLEHGYRRFRFAAILFLIFTLSLNQKSLADVMQNPVVIELKYSVKGFERYDIQILADGKVHYHENRITKEISTKAFIKPESVPIDHYSKLSKEQLNELIVDFLSLPFKELPKYEEKRGADLFLGLTISLKLYYVEIFVDDVLLHRALLTKLKKHISKDLSSWLCNSDWRGKDSIKKCEQNTFLAEDFKF